MSLSMEALSHRTMSSYALSIGTALALESINLGPQPVYDESRPIPNRVELEKYETFYVNLMTLFRNILGSLSKEGQDVVMPQDLHAVLEQEVETFREVIRQESQDRTQCIFYTSDYAGLQQAYPHASLRTDHTDKQKIYTALMRTTLGLFYKGQVKSETLQHFSLRLKPKKPTRALILTHFAYDLLSYPDFQSLELLESHTGVLKNRALFYTKFHNGKGLARIPFRDCFLVLFGDSQLFHPMPKKLRDAVLAIAERYNWNWNTTSDRILLGLNELSDPYAKDILKSML